MSSRRAAVALGLIFYCAACWLGAAWLVEKLMELPA